MAQTGKQAGGETEFGSEAGNSVQPRIWISADAQEDRGEIGVDDAVFAGSENSSRYIHEIKILGFSHVENAAVLGIGLDGAQPASGRDWGMGGDGLGHSGGNAMQGLHIAAGNGALG